MCDKPPETPKEPKTCDYAPRAGGVGVWKIVRRFGPWGLIILCLIAVAYTTTCVEVQLICTHCAARTSQLRIRFLGMDFVRSREISKGEMARWLEKRSSSPCTHSWCSYSSRLLLYRFSRTHSNLATGYSLHAEVRMFEKGPGLAEVLDRLEAEDPQFVQKLRDYISDHDSQAAEELGMRLFNAFTEPKNEDSPKQPDQTNIE